MNKKVKIALIATSIVAFGIGTFFAVKFYKLRKAYKSSITPEELQKIIDEKAKGIGNEFEEDDAIKNADKRLGGGEPTNLSDSTYTEPTNVDYDPNDPETWSDADWTRYYAQNSTITSVSYTHLTLPTKRIV